MCPELKRASLVGMILLYVYLLAPQDPFSIYRYYCTKARVHPSCLQAKAVYTLDKFASLSQGHIERQTTIRTRTHTYRQLTVPYLPHMHVVGLCEEAGEPTKTTSTQRDSKPGDQTRNLDNHCTNWWLPGTDLTIFIPANEMSLYEYEAGNKPKAMVNVKQVIKNTNKISIACSRLSCGYCL